jgi:hypothetical protein
MKNLAIAAVVAVLGASGCGEREVDTDETVVTEPAAPLATPDTAAAPVSTACSQYGMIDRDGDNRISQAEFAAFRTGAFNDWDADDDNRITQADYERCWGAGGFYGGELGVYNTSFGAFDANSDTYLDENEFFGDRTFSTWDANRDGYLTEDEWL